jgi:HMG (high mobility group) box
MKEEAGETKPKVATAKRPTKKKPKDKPKRPLSAYNFFFKEEREKILKVVLADDPTKVENDPESEDYLSDEMLGRLRKEGGKVSFEEMGKLIGQRWKNIDPDRLTRFSELASEDTDRYKKEMVDYNGRQEAKMRSEALKPPAAFAGREMKGADARQGGYPDAMNGMNSMGFQAGMASGGYPYGMDFSGYGMPMGMYGYGGYPMGGQGMGGNAEAMARMNGQMPDGAAQYGGGMYGMMGGGFQGGMMGYG